MPKFVIVAYPECDEGYLPRKEKTFTACDRAAALDRAWREFPEYHEVNAFKVED